MLRLTTWNCNMAFRKKAGAILQHRPQILVVPECEHPDRLHFPPGIPKPKDVLWIGDNPSKGLAVFSYSRYRFRPLPCHNPDLKFILPLAVSNGKTEFTLLAVWANHPADKGFVYVGQLWKALRHYADLLEGPVILAGDFNSNTIFDKPKREGNHSTIVAKLEERKIYSCYHQKWTQAQGKEKHPTHYLYRHLDKPYHLDYCFVSAHFKTLSVTVGEHKDWCTYSDHVPLTVRLAPV